MRRLIAHALAVATLSGVAVVARADAPDFEGLLARAFEVRHDCDTAARLSLEMTGRDGSRRHREIELLTKRIDGRLHALARLEAPADLRGMALLTLENRGRADDTWVYLPSLRRNRRITAHRRADAFLGSDLAYADFERHRVDEYRVLGGHAETIGADAVWRIVTVPQPPSVNARIDFWVAEADAALLRIEGLPGRQRAPGPRARDAAQRDPIARRVPRARAGSSCAIHDAGPGPRSSPAA